MQKIELGISTENPSITILEGKALEQKPPEKIRIKGDIKTVSSYLKVRQVKGSGVQEIDLSKAVVLVDKSAMTIELMLDPENYYGAAVMGCLDLSDELKKWHINEEFTYSLKDFRKHVQFSRLDFDSSDKYTMLYDALQKFNMKGFVESSNQEDTRGNKSQAFNKKLETGIPMDFMLNIPIFKGFESKRFGVEICIESVESYVNFWLQSVNLHELIKTEKDIIFNEELKACEGFVIINK